MKICVAQTKPVKGDIPANIAGHTKLISLAVVEGAGMIIFPELSVTGYEPGLAKDLSIDKDDNCLDVFQHVSDEYRLIIAVGMPVRSENGILIGMIIFQPQQLRLLYAKHHLHADEYPYFVNGDRDILLKTGKHTLSFAICYELLVPEHAARAGQGGADIYIASVAKTPDGMVKASQALSETAKKYSMTILLSNCVGHCDDFDCGGRTAVWNNKGMLAGQLDGMNEGILIVDTDTMEVIAKQYIPGEISFV
ncbi:MAG: carbon-nitrogen hydrolase family protein [Chitinophagaceae bacterium]|nr:carbon-nitrogen hydrolase family protein [Chitinophagaceae bacterium]